METINIGGGCYINSTPYHPPQINKEKNPRKYFLAGIISTIAAIIIAAIVFGNKTKAELPKQITSVQEVKEEKTTEKPVVVNNIVINNIIVVENTTIINNNDIVEEKTLVQVEKTPEPTIPTVRKRDSSCDEALKAHQERVAKWKKSLGLTD